MEVNPQQLQQLFLVLGSGTSEQTRKSAELQIVNLRQNLINYPLIILQLIAKPNDDIQLRASIEFKLWSQQYAAIQQFQADKFSSIMPAIKNNVLSLYLTVGDRPYKQLKDAITSLCKKEYYQNWKQLISQLIQVSGQKYEFLIRILSLFKNITERYSYELRSDPLYQEIIYSCNNMHDFLKDSCTNLLQAIKQNILNQEALKAMKEALKLFYNLNYQDLHPHFEDNLQFWMSLLNETLALEGSSQNIQLFKCKGACLKSILLYSSKYQEDILDETIQKFSSEVWKLFTGNNKFNSNTEKLVLDGLKFFRFLITWSGQKKSYSDHVPDLINTLVIENIKISQDVKDDFQGDAERFIQCYFENADSSSKRSFAIDLLKTIIRVYPTEFNNFMMNYLQTQCSKQLSIEDECLMYNLIVDAGAAAYRSIQGCTHLNIPQNIVTDCYTGLLKPKFQQIYEWILKNEGKEIESQINPIQIAFQLRYIYVFRIFMPQEDLPLLLKYSSSLVSNSQSLRNIIYLTTDAFLCVRHGDYLHYNNLQFYFKPQNIEDVAMTLLKMIYLNQQKEKTLNKRLNALLCSMTTVFKQKMILYSKIIINIITNLLAKTDTYQFKTILPIFQAFGNFIYWMTTQNQDMTEIEALLQDYLGKLMGIGSDLINFILQLYSIVLLVKTSVPSTYDNIYNSLLKIQNWTDNNSSLFNSYIFYITSYLRKHPSKALENKTDLEFILSKIIESKKPAIFFRMLTQIYDTCGLESFSQTGYLNMIAIGTQTMVQSMPEIKTSILKSALTFIAHLINTSNPQIVVDYIKQTMSSFLESILLESVQIISTIAWRQERKPIVISISSLLNTNAFSSIQTFGIILNALIKNTNRRARYSSSSLLQKNPLPIQGSFQRLSVFKLIKTTSNTSKGFQMDNENQQKYLVECINKLIAQNGIQKIGGMLTEENQKQLSNLITKYQQEKQPVV